MTYDGGPRDQSIERARLARQEREIQKQLDKANLRVHLGYLVENLDDVYKLADFLYDLGYRKTT